MRIGEPGCEEGNLEAGLYDIIKTRANMRCGMAYYTRTGMLYECRGHYEGVLNRPHAVLHNNCNFLRCVWSGGEDIYRVVLYLSIRWLCWGANVR